MKDIEYAIIPGEYVPANAYLSGSYIRLNSTSPATHIDSEVVLIRSDGTINLNLDYKSQLEGSLITFKGWWFIKARPATFK